jgi:hypothetical protein
MSKNTYPLKLPTSVKKAAAELAASDGVSLNQLTTYLGHRVFSLPYSNNRKPRPRKCNKSR